MYIHMFPRQECVESRRMPRDLLRLTAAEATPSPPTKSFPTKSS